MRIKTKTMLVIILGFVVVFASGLAGLAYLHHHQSLNPSPQSHKVNGVDYGPPTEAQKKAGDQVKQQPAHSPSTTTSTQGQQSVIVTIVRLNQITPGQNVNLRANLSSNVNSGQCVATFTQAGRTPVTVTTGIASNPTYFSCEPIDVSASQLNGGTWQATVYVEQNGTVVSNQTTASITVRQ